jgi:hypothetical protein
MKRLAVWVALPMALLLFAGGCALNPRLEACFSILPDPAGDPMTFLFNAACSTYYDEPLLPTEAYIFEWHFGDTNTRVAGNVLTNHTYWKPGTYAVELLIIGWDGEMARTTRNVTVGGS